LSLLNKGNNLNVDFVGKGLKKLTKIDTCSAQNILDPLHMYFFISKDLLKDGSTVRPRNLEK
jgi:hypothetical protein